MALFKKILKKKDGQPSKVNQILKRKVGGTVVGNMARAVLSQATGGILGQGQLMLKQDQTPEENNAIAQEQIIEQLGAASAAVKTVQSKQSVADKMKEKGIGFILKIVLIPVVIVLVIVFIVKKMSNSNKPKRR